MRNGHQVQHLQVTEVHLRQDVAISCSQDGTVRFWNLTTGTVMRVIHNRLHVQSMAVDDRLLVITDRSNMIIVFCLQSCLRQDLPLVSQTIPPS